MKKGFFITFEGCEGCGKTTQALLLYRYLTDRGYDVVHTREPGGTGLAETLRKVLLDPATSVSPLAELLLYEASRAQHVDELIVPALAQGRIVLCDRFTDATLAYQGYGRGLDTTVIRRLNGIATGSVRPDMTVYLDILPARGLERARRLNKDAFACGGGDRLEREALAFHRRVRKGYLELAGKEPRRIRVVRTAATIEKTHDRIVSLVEEALKKGKRKP